MELFSVKPDETRWHGATGICAGPNKAEVFLVAVLGIKPTASSRLGIVFVLCLSALLR